MPYKALTVFNAYIRAVFCYGNSESRLMASSMNLKVKILNFANIISVSYTITCKPQGQSFLSICLTAGANKNKSQKNVA